MPAAAATSSIGMFGPNSSARSPTRTSAGTSVTSTAIRSMETRPAIGARCPRSKTEAPGADRRRRADSRRHSRPPRIARRAGRSKRLRRAVAHRLAFGGVANLQDARLCRHDGFDPAARHRRAAVESDSRPDQVEMIVAAEQDAGGIGEARRERSESYPAFRGRERAGRRSSGAPARRRRRGGS